MIAVDASALVAIAVHEPEEHQFVHALARSSASLIAPTNYVEAGMVLVSRGVFSDQSYFDDWLAKSGLGIARDLDLTSAALAAYLRYGKGRHPARLNLGDCFAYALAKALDAPLLYKGNDFPQTDIRSAI